MKKTFGILSKTALITLLSALWILVLPQFTTSVYADSVTVSDEAGLRYAFENASTTPNNPTEIVLGSDITLAVNGRDLDVNNTYVVLNLNGKNLNLGSGSNNIDVYNSGNLSISGGGEIIANYYGVSIDSSVCTISDVTVRSSNDSAVEVSGNGTLNVNGGTLTSTAQGNEVVYVTSGIFNLTGGTIVSPGGTTQAVKLISNSEFHMSGGRIDGGDGITVYVNDPEVRIEMSGGTIESSGNVGETVITKGTTVITGGTIKNTGSGDALHVSGGNVSITGGTISNTGGGEALNVMGGTATQNGGTIIGRIDTGGTGTFDYQSGVNDDHPAGSSSSGKDDDDDHEDAPAPAPKPLNPNAILVSSFTGIGGLGGNVKIGPQVQGPAAQLAFRNGTPAGWKEAFTFNMTVKDKADYILKKGTLSVRIPTQYLNAGRKFAILGLDKNGKVKVFNDTDLKADTITVNLDIEGYAFDLIYSD